MFLFKFFLRIFMTNIKNKKQIKIPKTVLVSLLAHLLIRLWAN